MKKKYFILLLLVEVILVSITSGQAVGIGTSVASGFPLSTLDISGTFGFTISKNTGVETATVLAAQPGYSTVLYTQTNGQLTVTLPTASATYFRRIYILSYAVGNKSSITISPSYFDLTHTANTLLLFGKSIMLICDGTSWLQIL